MRYEYTKLSDLPANGNVNVFGIVEEIETAFDKSMTIRIRDDTTHAILRVERQSSSSFDMLKKHHVIRIHRGLVKGVSGRLDVSIRIGAQGCHAVVWVKGCLDAENHLFTTSRSHTIAQIDFDNLKLLNDLIDQEERREPVADVNVETAPCDENEAPQPSSPQEAPVVPNNKAPSPERITTSVAELIYSPCVVLSSTAKKDPTPEPSTSTPTFSAPASPQAEEQVEQPREAATDDTEEADVLVELEVDLETFMNRLATLNGRAEAKHPDLDMAFSGMRELVGEEMLVALLEAAKKTYLKKRSPQEDVSMVFRTKLNTRLWLANTFSVDHDAMGSNTRSLVLWEVYCDLCNKSFPVKRATKTFCRVCTHTLSAVKLIARIVLPCTVQIKDDKNVRLFISVGIQQLNENLSSDILSKEVVEKAYVDSEDDFNKWKTDVINLLKKVEGLCPSECFVEGLVREQNLAKIRSEHTIFRIRAD